MVCSVALFYLVFNMLTSACRGGSFLNMYVFKELMWWATCLYSPKALNLLNLLLRQTHVVSH